MPFRWLCAFPLALALATARPTAAQAQPAPPPPSPVVQACAQPLLAQGYPREAVLVLCQAERLQARAQAYTKTLTAWEDCLDAQAATGATIRQALTACTPTPPQAVRHD